ncbi:MAG: methionyl-tRNA formyltransferase [Planctomycetes bacterium]|nr:methionyl-tRNA formyltransferase [Planctomycetota bacterium]
MNESSVAFLGSGSLGEPCLRAFARRGWIDVVVSQPDRPAGRGRATTPTPISTSAMQCGLKLLRTADANHPEVREQCAKAKVIVVIAFGQKLLPELLAGRTAINLHPSALPKWRGAAPIQRAMMAGEERIDACAMQVAPRMDAGAIYSRQSFDVGATETAGELHDRVARESVPMMVETVERALKGVLVGQDQDESMATRAAKLSKAEAFVDFSMPARLVRCRIHGLAPWPGCDAEIAGETIRLLRVREVAAAARATSGAGASSAMPGDILGDGLISCGEGAIELLSVQPAGGRAMEWAVYCRGRSIKPGQRMTSQPRKEPA